MKAKARIIKEEEFPSTNYTYDSYEVPFVNRPLKSPSPDKKSANIIVSTRSPDIHELKRTVTPSKEEGSGQRGSQRSQVKEKHFQFINTPNQHSTFKNVDPSSISAKNAQTGTSRRDDRSGGEIRPSSPRNSRSRNIKIEIAADEEVEVRPSASRYRTEFRGQLSELDYLSLLKAKEETIKELNDCIDALEARSPDQTILRTYQSRITAANSQIRELKIENQYLLSAVQKEKEKVSKSKGRLDSTRQEQLQREVRRLQDALKSKCEESEQQIASLTRRLEKQQKQRKQTDLQNQSFLRLLNQRQQEEKRDEPLGASSLSQQGRVGSDKDKLTLTKIKELHQENLRIAQESAYNDIKQMEESFLGQLEAINAKVEHLADRLARAEAGKREAQGRKGLGAREQAHREKERHQEIETVLLEKYSYYQKQLQEQKRENEKLNHQLSNAHRDIEDLQLKSLTYSRQLSYLTNHDDQELLETLHREKEAQVHTITSLQKELNNAQKDLSNTQKQLAAAQKELAALGVEKQEVIRVAENKLMLILEEYESKIKAERAQHQDVVRRLGQEVGEWENRQQELQEQHERQKAEIQQQLKDALKLYDKQITGLKNSLVQKNSEILALNELIDKMRSEAQQAKQTDRRDSQEVAALTLEKDLLKNQTLALQKSVELLTQQLEETAASAAKDKQQIEAALKDALLRANQLEGLNQSLKSYAARLEQERHALQQGLTNAREELTLNQEEQVEVLARLREELDRKDSQIERLKGHILQADAEKDRLQAQKKQLQAQLNALKSQFDTINDQLQALRKDRRSLSYDSIEEQLKQLRQMVTDYYASNQNRLDNEIVEDYYRLAYNHQLKIEENLRLSKEAEELRTQAAADSRERLILSQKIALLENNIAIYEKQLRQRKHLYDQLLQEKARIEKEVLLSKRIKAEQSTLVEGFKASTSEIASKIDRLVDFERQRFRQIRALVQETTDVQ